MIVLPAIDLQNRKCVRLEQGVKERETIYNDNPLAVAQTFEKAGLSWIHIVDLDAAFTGENKNADIILDIRKQTGLSIQVGGGIRSEETVRFYLDQGIDRVIIGTRAVEDPDFIKEMSRLYPGKIAIAVDAKGDRIVKRGWVDSSGTSVIDFCKNMEENGASTLIYTDVSRDGMLTGPNLEVLKKIQSAVSTDIIASGGVSGKDDLKKIHQMGLYGVITGKAFYEGVLSLEEMFEMEQKNVD